MKPLAFFILLTGALLLGSCNEIVKKVADDTAREKRIGDSLALIEEEELSLEGFDYISDEYKIYQRSKEGGDSVLKVRIFYKTGEKFAERTYRNGLLDGTSVMYHKNGSVFTRLVFKNGRQQEVLEIKDNRGDDLPGGTLKNGTGQFVFYSPVTDQKVFAINYVNSKRNGEALFYYETGELKAKTNFLNDSLHGKMEISYRNGGTRSVENYRHGIQDGRQLSFYAHGKMRMEAMYQDGVLKTLQEYDRNGHLVNYTAKGVSKKMSYYPNGDIMTEGCYTDGYKDGPFKYYYEKRKLREEETWKRDTLVHDKKFHENGKLASEANYKAGMRDGEYLEFYPNGNKRLVALYKNDQKNGVSTAYYENGRKYFTGNYTNGEADGKFDYWTETGVFKGSNHYKLKAADSTQIKEKG